MTSDWASVSGDPSVVPVFSRTRSASIEPFTAPLIDTFGRSEEDVSTPTASVSATTSTL